MDPAKAETRMMRVLLKQSVGLTRLLPHVFGQDSLQGQELWSEERIHSSFTSSFLGASRSRLGECFVRQV